MMKHEPGLERAAAAREAMVAGQLLPNRVTDPRVADAVRAVPRELFVPKSLRGIACIDDDLEIAPGRFLMEPMVFGRLLVEARIASGETVLDIGCASGYSTAVLARLAETVIAVEEDAELARQATTRLAELGANNTVVIEAPLAQGAPAGQGPFDVIVMEGAVEVIPEALTSSLADGGRLLCVLRRGKVSRAHLVLRSGDAFGGRDLFDAFVPILPGFAAGREFVF